MTTEEIIVNQMALRNLADTSTGGTVFVPADLQIDAGTIAERSYSFVGFGYFDIVTTSATFATPPKRETSLLKTIFDDLDRLDLRTNPLFKPSDHAARSARRYVLHAYARMGNAFPRPSFVLDGENGIIIKWVKNGYTVRLNCLANDSDGDYIYFENGEYDVEDNVTIDVLVNRLNWLIKHEREPPR